MADAKKPQNELQAQIGIPFEVHDGGRAGRRIDVSVTGKQAVTMRRIRLGLIRDRATIRDGRLVQNDADVVRWFLETMAACIGQE